MPSIKLEYTLPYGATMRVGYRQKNSSEPYTYHTHYPTYNESPYTITGVSAGTYEVELTTICPNCGSGTYGEPIVVDAIA